MHKQIRFQTNFRLVIVVAIMVTIFGLFAFTPTLAENSIIKLSDIQLMGGDIKDFEISADNNWVVYRADHTMEDVDELYSVPTDSSALPIKLNSTLGIEGKVDNFQFSADSSWVVYTVYYSIANTGKELYGVPIDGSAPPVKLYTPLDDSDSVTQNYKISADSSQVVFTANHDVQNIIELYTVPIDGSAAPTKLNDTLVSGGNVSAFQISMDNTMVVYLADQDTDNINELYKVALDGSATPVKLNDTLPSGGSVCAWCDFQITVDSSRVVYVADQDVVGTNDLYSLPIDGSTLPIKLNSTLPSGSSVSPFKISTDSHHVVYLADQDTQYVDELYSVPIDGSVLPIKLNDTLISGGEVNNFHISGDGNLIVYRADQDVVDLSELFSVPIDGSTDPIKLNGTLFSDGGVNWYFQISADSTRVVYLDGLNTEDDVKELYSTPIDGSNPPTKLNSTLVNGGDVWHYQISADSSQVVYSADQDTDDIHELFSISIDGNSTPTKLNGTFPSENASWYFQISNDSNQVVFVSNYWVIDFDAKLYSVPINGGTSPVRLDSPQVLVGDVVEDNQTSISADSKWVVYLADQDTDDVNELYSVLIDGTLPPIKLNTPLVVGQEVYRGFQISPDSTHVVFLTDEDADDVFELYSAPIDGSDPPVKLNNPLVGGYGVYSSYQISADSNRVVYQVDQNLDYVYELYSVPIDGSTPPIQINTPMSSGYNESFFQISHNSQTVVYRTDQDTIDVDELYSVAIDGSTLPTKLNSTHTGNVKYFQISADGSQVVYNIEENLMGYLTELYSVPINGSAAPIKLNETLGPGGTLGYFFKISGSSNRVVYMSEYDYMSDPELYSVPLDGSAAPIKLNGTLISGGEITEFQISVDGNYVTYQADQDTNDVDELYSVPIDGGIAPIKLNGTLVSGGVVSRYQISGDSSQVVYRANQDINDVYELFSVPIDGSSVPIKLNGALVSGGNVYSSKISADSSRVVYKADQDTDDVGELYSIPIDGSSPPFKLNETVSSGGDVRSFQISADNNWVVYSGDLDVPHVNELYAYGEHTLTDAIADFSATPTSGVVPLVVDFSNLSTGDYSICDWDFGDGSSNSNCDDPSYTFNQAGTFTVTLNISGLGSTDSEMKSSYIAVYEPPVANFNATPITGNVPLTVNFNNLSSGEYASCLWDYGDGIISDTCTSLAHTYVAPGSYTVTLTIDGLAGINTINIPNYITVEPYKLFLPVVLKPS